MAFGRWRLGGDTCCECEPAGTPCVDPECDPDDVASGPLFVTVEYDDTTTDTQPYVGGDAFFECPNGYRFRVSFGCFGGDIGLTVNDETGFILLCGEAPCAAGHCVAIVAITCPPLVVEVDASDCFLTSCAKGLLSITLHT